MQTLLIGVFSLIAGLGLLWELLTGQVGRADGSRIAARPGRALFWVLMATPVLGLALLLAWAWPLFRTPRGGRWPWEAATPTPVSASAASACPVSEEATYGVTPENPVRVGGGDFEGALRTSAYLQNLRGPMGETITFVPRGSLAQAGSTLTQFQVSYTGLDQPLMLYVDHYHDAAPQAPLGFRCASPLSWPAPG